MRDGLLGAVVDHLLSLDVEIRWQDIAERPGGFSHMQTWEIRTAAQLTVECRTSIGCVRVWKAGVTSLARHGHVPVHGLLSCLLQASCTAFQ